MKKCPFCGNVLSDDDEHEEKKLNDNDDVAATAAADCSCPPPPVSSPEKPSEKPMPETPARQSQWEIEAEADNVSGEKAYHVEPEEMTAAPSGGNLPPCPPDCPPRFPESHRRKPAGKRLLWLWILLGIIGLAVAGGVLWYMFSGHASTAEAAGGADSDSTDQVEVLDYESDDTPSGNDSLFTDNSGTGDDDVAATPVEPGTASADAATDAAAGEVGAEPEESGVSIEEHTLSGTLQASDAADEARPVSLRITISNGEQVRGTVSYDGKEVPVTGVYYSRCRRLFVRESGSVYFQGSVSGNVYTGTYHDASGDRTFRLTIR